LATVYVQTKIVFLAGTHYMWHLVLCTWCYVGIGNTCSTKWNI